MDKALLEGFLAQGMSLDAIGERMGKHPSTVSYWLKKHGLTAVGAARHTPKGRIDPDRLRDLIDSGASIRDIAEKTGAGYSTIRYWLGRLGLETAGSTRRQERDSARKAGLKRAYLRCRKHGHTACFERPARMRAEARKCILLCANCHALVEAGVASVPEDVGKVVTR